MADHDLGQGSRIESLAIAPSFPFKTASATLNIPDAAFPEIKGSIRITGGPNPDATTLGQTAMGATATFVVKGHGDHSVGFKQIAFLNFRTAIYAGLKDSDGSIVESSTGLNFQRFLDCSVNANLVAPWAPFYLPVAAVRIGASVSIEMVDQPGGRYRLQRRNSGRDRLNFLLSIRESTDFVTFVVVQLPSGRHVPVEGFTWTHRHEIDMAWTNGNPTVDRNDGSVRFSERLDGLAPGDARLDIFANAALRSDDTIVAQFNKAMFAAARKQPTSGYQIKENDNYTEDVTPDMLRRFRNNFR